MREIKREFQRRKCSHHRSFISLHLHLPFAAAPESLIRIPLNPNPIAIATTAIVPSNLIYSPSLLLPATISNNTITFTKQQTQQETQKFTQNGPPVHQLLSLNSDNDPESRDRSGCQNREQDPNLRGKAPPPRVKKRKGISPSMWWAEFKASFGQRVNFEGIVWSDGVFFRNPQLALSHVLVPDVGYIDWGELQRRGFKGVVFDKDNSITAPYSLKLPSIERCKSVFGLNIAVFSNSAGIKKPAGDAEEIEKHFGWDSSYPIMAGDRLFTDIVYGNRNGFFIILVKPLSLTEEPFIVRQVRKLETSLLNCWLSIGLKPAGHCLLPDPSHCLKNPKS